jgi:hypothetical protein
MFSWPGRRRESAPIRRGASLWWAYLPERRLSVCAASAIVCSNSRMSCGLGRNHSSSRSSVIPACSIRFVFAISMYAMRSRCRGSSADVVPVLVTSAMPVRFARCVHKRWPISSTVYRRYDGFQFRMALGVLRSYPVSRRVVVSFGSGMVPGRCRCLRRLVATIGRFPPTDSGGRAISWRSKCTTSTRRYRSAFVVTRGLSTARSRVCSSCTGHAVRRAGGREEFSGSCAPLHAVHRRRVRGRGTVWPARSPRAVPLAACRG